MGFELPRVTQCCFCVPLRVASLLIGYFSIIASCLTLAAVSFYTYKVVTYVKDISGKPNPQHSPEEVQHLALSLYLSFGYYMLVFLYNLFINLLLVIGVHRNIPKYLRIYVNASYVLLVLGVALVVLTCMFMGFIATIPMLKWTFMVLIMIIIVRSTCLEMEEQNKPRTIEMQDLYTPQRAPLIV